MKKSGFLHKLRKEMKLSLVEPSEEIMQAYIEKSESNLASAKILLQNNKLEEAVALVYYSMYHTLTSLLFRTGIKSENHSASIILLKRVFGIDNSEISYSKRERVDKQYYVDFKITKDEVNDAIRKAERFSSKLTDFISRLAYEDIKAYRKKFREIIGI